MICLVKFLTILVWILAAGVESSQEVTHTRVRQNVTLLQTAPDGQQLSAVDHKQYLVPRDTPIAFLDGNAAFNGLKPIEKCKVQHLSKASWVGALIDLYQTSPESPYIFLLLQNIFRSEELQQLKLKATGVCNFTQNDWDSFLVYTAVFYDNLGNYYSYGMNKFIPEVSENKLGCFIQAVQEKLKKKDVQPKVSISEIWAKIKSLVYNLNKRYRHQGFGPDGVTTYFSANCDGSDAKIVKDYLVVKGVEAWNTRVIKTVNATGQATYEIRFASAETSNDTVDGVALGVVELHKGNNFIFTRGDYSFLLAHVLDSLGHAKLCIDSELEESMTHYLYESFATGSLVAHKNASRLWVKNKNPVIESYIGFIEIYQDPDGMRGSFEGFVAVVDKEKSARLGHLVNRAETFLPLLPWPRQFEKDKFLKPDFTDLSIIAFGNGGPPVGINIPNYNEIRQTEGFKNVHLGNMVAATLGAKPMQYLTKQDADLLKPDRLLTFEIIVGLHELLGHGSGKLFHQLSDGTFDFNATEIGSVEKYGAVKKWYMPGETYESKFGHLGSTMEECRAEAVAAYLSLYPQVLEIWGINQTMADHYAYLVWLEEATEGLQGLAEYKPETDSWGEAHAQANFAIFRVMMESGAATVTVVNNSVDGQPDLLIRLDRNSLQTDGKKALALFLLGLEFFRSTGDVDGAQEFYSNYTSLKLPANQRFLEWQKITVARKEPRTLVIQPNLVPAINSSQSCQDVRGKSLCFPSLDLQNYNATASGMIQSFLDRFPDAALETELLELADADWQHFAI